MLTLKNLNSMVSNFINLTPKKTKKLLTTLPILLAQIQAANNSYKEKVRKQYRNNAVKIIAPR